MCMYTYMRICLVLTSSGSRVPSSSPLRVVATPSIFCVKASSSSRTYKQTEETIELDALDVRVNPDGENRIAPSAVSSLPHWSSYTGEKDS